MITHYPAVISKEDDVWMVRFPDFEQISTFGEFLEDAIQAAGEALNGCIETDFERGFDFPEPTIMHGCDVYQISLEMHLIIALELRKIRADRSQIDIARELGISYQAYQRLEHPAKSNPTVKTLSKIARALGKKLEIRFV
jgi:antitoxin HicB